MLDAGLGTGSLNLRIAAAGDVSSKKIIFRVTRTAPKKEFGLFTNWIYYI